MFQKFNLRTRTFVAYMVFIFFILITYLTYTFFATDLFSKLGSRYWTDLVHIGALPFDIILYSLIYLVSMILLLKGTYKFKKIAWGLALIPPLLMLFNPLPALIHFIPGISRGAIFLFKSLSVGDMITTLLILMEIIIFLLISIYGISGLVGYENKKFDSTLGIIFIIVFGLSLIGKTFISGGLIFLFYTGFVFLRKKRKILLPISLGLLFTFIARVMTLDDFRLRGGFFLLATISYATGLVFAILEAIKKHKEKQLE